MDTTAAARQTAQLSSIMYVEDDPDIQVIARIALENIGGFVVTLCASGQEALDCISCGAHPDLILLDVMMPDMDGPGTLAALRLLPETVRTPVIFLTAKIQARELAHLKSLGAWDVIAKPFDPMLLAQQIRQVWGKNHD